MKNNRFCFIVVLLISFLGSFRGAYAQGQLPAGTVISNTAELNYYSPLLDSLFNFSSNTVEAMIPRKFNVTLGPDNQFQTLQKSDTVRFTHRFTLEGNTDDLVLLTIQNATDDDFDFKEFVISDTRTIPVSSKSKPSSTPTTESSESALVPLKAGESIDIDLFGIIPDDVRVNQLGKMKIIARSFRLNYTVENTDSVLIIAGTNVDIRKRILTEEPIQGGLLTFELITENTGEVRALPVPVMIDGTEQSYMLIQDEIPANTVFEQFVELDGALGFYRTDSMEEETFTTVLPADKSTIVEIAYGLASLDIEETHRMTFDVRINNNASGEIFNTASVVYNNGLDEEKSTDASNEVTAPLPEYDANINYFTDDSFVTPTNAARVGSPLYLQADASSCNLDPTAIDTTQITLTSVLTGDIELFIGIENDVNSGLFNILPSVPTADFELTPVVEFNGTLETTENDEIIAELDACGRGGNSTTKITAYVIVDPSGVVFNSETGRVLSGATVTLWRIDDAGNRVPAEVFDFDGVSGFPNQVTTEAEGTFQFPYLRRGRYQFEVIPPRAFSFPSVVPQPLIHPTFRDRINGQGSYGEIFTITDATGTINFDIPLDIDGISMKMEKNVNKTTVEVGDYVTYQLKITNLIQAEIKNVQVVDELPYGFKYVEGSSRIGGNRVEDPIGSPGPNLTYVIDTLGVQQSVTISYDLKVGPAAMQSDGINIAVATADELVQKLSNQAEVKVEVQGGVFTDQAYIIGKVYYDRNRNRVQEYNEPGIPGVRLFLETGDFVITDEEGRYTLYGIDPNMHVLKVDESTLPIGGSALEVLDNRNAFDASSRFVDLHKGEIHKADFAICGCDGDILEEILARKEAARGLNAEMENTVEARLELADQTRNARNSVGMPSAGVKGKVQTVRFEPLIDEEEYKDRNLIAGDFVETYKWPDIDEVLEAGDVSLGFVDFTDGDTLAFSTVDIRVKGRIGTQFKLFVNDEEVGLDRVGNKSEWGNIVSWSYIGIPLTPGVNTLSTKMLDPFGNIRDESTIQVMAPGKATDIQILFSESELPADGQSRMMVDLYLVDANGLPVETRTPVNLDIDYGRMILSDLDPKEPGIQQFIQYGHGQFEIEAPSQAIDGLLRVQMGNLKKEQRISYVPDLRPLIAAGIIQGTLKLRDGFSINPATTDDGFERELQGMAYKNGAFSAEARAAFFLKGKVLGKYLLTAAYDSEKDEETTLFRDIRPDEFYPVYGDASIQGFDAQSSGRLFVKLERNKSYALIGDFQAQDQHPAVFFGTYNRNMNGAKVQVENDRVKASAYGTQGRTRLVFDEIPALGVSGPYVLSRAPIIRNSERIELITRDRNQPEVILKREQLIRFLDYSIEPFSGQILFNFPVYSMDSEFNPRFIRVSYESESDGDLYVTAGGDVQFKVNDFLEVGGTVVSDNNPEQSFNVASTNVTLNLTENSQLITEVAGTSSEEYGQDIAARTELRVQSSRADGRIFVGKTGSNFYNPFATMGQGRTEAGARGSIKFAKAFIIQTEAVHSQSDTSDVGRSGVMINLQRGFANNIQALMGMRYSRETSQANQTFENTTMRAKLTSSIPGLKTATMFGEYEQAINAFDRRVAAVGGDVQLGSRGKIYARHEFISSLAGRFGLNDGQAQNNTMVGFEAEYMKNGTVHTEYRVNDAFDGRQGQAAIGLRNRFVIREGWGLQASFERVFSVEGVAINEGTALGIGTDYTAAKNWKASARSEVRFSERGNVYLTSFGYGRKINHSWAFLTRQIFALNENDRAQARTQMRIQAGFAYRDYMTSRWNALSRYEFKSEQNDQQVISSDRVAHIISNHLSFQPNDDLILNGRLSGKVSTENSNEIRRTSTMALLSGRATYDLTRRFDVGAAASMLTDPQFESATYRVGAELGVIVARNLRLAAGFNVSGFHDRDLSAEEYTQKGPYMSMAYKFDEYTIKGLFRSNEETPEERFVCKPCEEKLVFNYPVTIPPDLPVDSIQALPLQPMVTLPLRIHFGLDKHWISMNSGEMTNHIAQFMKRNARYTINIVGHTDSRNTERYNINLSKRRAEATKAYLIGSGIDSTRIRTTAEGKKMLMIEKEENPVQEAENRRVEFQFDQNVTGVVRFTHTIEDLQIEKVEVNYYKNWDYLLTSDAFAVPSKLIFEDDSFLYSKVTEYNLRRLKLMMQRYGETSITFQGVRGYTTDQVLNQRLTSMYHYYRNNGIDTSRISTERLTYRKTDESPSYESRILRVVADSISQKKLKVSDNKVYKNFGINNTVPVAVEYMMKLQEERDDYALISRTPVINTLPKSVHFEFAKSDIDHRTGGFLARVAVYMNHNVQDTLTLVSRTDGFSTLGKGEEVAQARANAVKEYLINLGVDGSRILTTLAVETETPPTNDEMINSRKRRVDFEITSDENVEWIEQTYDLKPRAWMIK